MVDARRGMTGGIAPRNERRDDRRRRRGAALGALPARPRAASAAPATAGAAEARPALLGRLDRHPADRRPAALGHGGGLAASKHARQGPLADPVRRALRRLLPLRPAPLRLPHHEMRQSAATARSRSSAGAPRRSPSSATRPARLPARRRHPRRLRPLHPRVRPRSGSLGPPLLPPLRLGDERQLVPLGEGANGNKPGEYVAAWRHVHDIFAAAGATNATWVWCPYADVTPQPAPSPSYYPGDAYVDWTCLDGYNWANNRANTPALDELRRNLRRQLLDDHQQASPRTSR